MVELDSVSISLTASPSFTHVKYQLLIPQFKQFPSGSRYVRFIKILDKLLYRPHVQTHMNNYALMIITKFAEY